MAKQDIPTGRYDGWATDTREEIIEGSPIESRITADKDGIAQIAVAVAVAEQGADDPSFTHIEYLCIDPELPPRGDATKTPYEFSEDILVALGATSKEAVWNTLREAFSKPETPSAVVIPGLGAKRADVVVDIDKKGYKRVRVFPKRGLSEDAAKSMASKFAARPGAAPAAAPPPVFSPRGRPVPPPAAQGAAK